MEERPDPDSPGVVYPLSYFSNYDGYLMLSTWQLTYDLYPPDETGALPMFMEPMGWR